MADGKKTSMPLDSGRGPMNRTDSMARGGEHTLAEVPANNPKSASPQAPSPEGMLELEPSTGDLSLPKDLTHDSITSQENCVPQVATAQATGISSMTPGNVSSSQNSAAIVRSNTTDPSQVGAAMAASQEHGARPKVQATKHASLMPGNVRSDQHTAAIARSNTTDSSQVEAAMAALQEHDSFSTFDGRRQTFSDWEKFADDLCEAGFYLMAKCHHCGFELGRQELNTPVFDAWTTHARDSKGCQFVIKAKGKKFVNEVNKPLAKKDFTSIGVSLFINNNFVPNKSNESLDQIQSKSNTDGTATGSAQNTTGADNSNPVNGTSDNNQPGGAERPRSLTMNPLDQQLNTSGEVAPDEMERMKNILMEVKNLEKKIDGRIRELNLKQDQHDQQLNSYGGQFNEFNEKQEATDNQVRAMQSNVSDQGNRLSQLDLQLSSHDGQFNEVQGNLQDIGHKVEDSHHLSRQNTQAVESLEARTGLLEGRGDSQDVRVSELGGMTKIVSERVDNVLREQQELTNRVNNLIPNLDASSGNTSEPAGAADPAIAFADENEGDANAEDAESAQETDV